MYSGALVAKRPVLCLTYLETEVAGPFAFPRGTQADWKVDPKHLTCPPHLGGRTHLDSQEDGARFGLS